MSSNRGHGADMAEQLGMTVRWHGSGEVLYSPMLIEGRRGCGVR